MSDERFFDARHDPGQVPLSKLAFLGDAVFELLVRELLVEKYEIPFEKINEYKRRFVCAAAQSADAEKILPVLSEEESAIYRRGRNAKHKSVPKNSTPGEYSRATGFEALVGYLYLKGQKQRILELFSIIDGGGE